MDGVVGVELRAPKPGELPLGTSFLSISFLKIKELRNKLVVARCAMTWLRMHGVPTIFPQRRRGESQAKWLLATSSSYRFLLLFARFGFALLACLRRTNHHSSD